jgi:2-desacetyl-2-hydroxyethyl bacteriochlorophyllide A dehydrogenase
MKALVFRGDRMVLEDVADPEPGPGEVLLKVRYCGICGSDIHTFSRGVFFVGTIPGHEVSCEVAALGPGTSGWQVGDRVIAVSGRKCGQCEYCRMGRPHLCLDPEDEFGLGHRPGGFAQWLVTHQDTLLPVPPHLELTHAALAEPLAVAIHAVEISEIQPGQDAVITGAGPIGLLVADVLKSRGVGPIIISEPIPSRRTQASRLGLDRVVDPTTESLADAVRSTIGRGTSTVFETSGVPAVAQECFTLLRPAGTLVVVGITEMAYAFSCLLMIARELRVQAACAAAGRMPAALELLASGKVHAAEVITRVVSLDEAEACMRELRDTPADGKVLIDPWLAAAA